jgi:hypothetical protein
LVLHVSIVLYRETVHVFVDFFSFVKKLSDIPNHDKKLDFIGESLL